MTFKLEQCGNTFTYRCPVCNALVRAPQWAPLGKERHAAPIRTNPLNLLLWREERELEHRHGDLSNGEL
jgi:hypothetical protein